MRAERDAFAERLRHVETATLQQDTSAVEELQVLVQFKWNSGNHRGSLVTSVPSLCCTAQVCGRPGAAVDLPACYDADSANLSR